MGQWILFVCSTKDFVKRRFIISKFDRSNLTYLGVVWLPSTPASPTGPDFAMSRKNEKSLSKEPFIFISLIYTLHTSKNWRLGGAGDNDWKSKCFCSINYAVLCASFKPGMIALQATKSPNTCEIRLCSGYIHAVCTIATWGRLLEAWLALTVG